MSKLIECKSLSKMYLRRLALNQFNYSFEEGKIYGILGPNGSGKTTLMKILANLHHQTSGAVLIEDEIPSSQTRAKVAFMPAEEFIYGWMTVKQAISYYEDMYKDFEKDKALELMTFMELTPNQKVATLSTGQKGRLKILLTLSRNTKIYLLDEPLNGLDPVSRDMIKEIIIKSVNDQSTIILSTHLVNQIEQIFDEVIFISKGEVILVGSSDALRTTYSKSIEGIYREVFAHE